jgi:hypothetical protein
MKGSGRSLIGGLDVVENPVKKRGPWVDANLRVVTPFRKVTDLHSPRPSVADRRIDDGKAKDRTAPRN